MALVVVVKSKVHVANTSHLFTRTRPLGGPVSVGDPVTYDSDGNWILVEENAAARGIVLGIANSGMPLESGDVGDDAEVCLEGILAGFTVAPNAKVYNAGDGTLDDAGTTEQVIGIGLDSSLLYVRPTFGADLIV